MHEQVRRWPTFLCCAVVTVRINAAQQSRLDKSGFTCLREREEEEDEEEEEDDREGFASVDISFHIQTDSVWFT